MTERYNGWLIGGRALRIWKSTMHEDSTAIVLLQAAFDDLLTVCDCSYPGERSDMYCAVCSARSHITNALAELEKGE